MVIKAKSDMSSTKKSKTMKNKGGAKLKGPAKQKRKQTDAETSETPHKKIKKQKVQPEPEPEEQLQNVEEEEMTAEERRVLERKMKKILKKEQKRQKKEEGIDEEKMDDQSKAAKRALEYLSCWAERRSEWRFKKIRQTWLLQHMYDGEKVSDASFSIMLLYLENLRGAARDITVQKAEALIKEDKGGHSQSADEQKRIQRALEVVRLLSVD